MRTDEQFDDLFRKALPSVDPPEPPAMDWAAMARMARTGSRGAAGGAASARTLRWLKLLGGASVLVVAWYFAFRSPLRAKPEVLAQVPAARAGSAGDEQPAQLSSSAPQQMSRPVEEQPAAVTAAHIPQASTPKARATAHAIAGEGAITSTISAGASADYAAARGRGSGSNTTTRSDAPTDGVAYAGNVEQVPTAQDEQEVSGNELLASADLAGASMALLHLDLLPPLRDELAHLPHPAAQGADGPAPSFFRWSISPWLALGHSTFIDDTEGSEAALDELTEGGELLGTAGFRLQYMIDRRFTLLTGLQYSSKGSLHGTVHSSPMLYTDYALSGTYLEVPIAVKYILPFENKDLYVRLGALLQFNTQSGSDKVVLHDLAQKQMSTIALGTGSMGTALDLAAGVQFRLSKRVGLFIEPSYQIGLSPMIKYPSFDQLPVNPRINAFSLGTGLVFQFHDK